MHKIKEMKSWLFKEKKNLPDIPLAQLIQKRKERKKAGEDVNR